MWKIRIVKVGRGYEALGYLDGACQGSFWNARSMEKITADVSARYPNIDVVLG